ncbi:DNA topoisomerase-1 [Rhodobium orientis]|uniref:DNA topoisomerase 1 n=1 Tax=Rhodobium orientis TaxID=34017 RepID=A0A327JJA1_9HYPH|nr:type I DNA topoisomerase [Rhodobium orientis]MBB4301501.1 DNA topoisomerase-1 [Rhodobium orientis]MBK5952198.1 DNA topoisomerase I [Rhodobium orientis]RAI25464.1 DNA topoisomerase I [Rhodobium orientis]
MRVVIVESPAKAKTINKYLGSDYQVMASFGHVRDLPAKDGSVDPDNDFSMTWEVDGKANKRLSEIAKAVKSSDGLILATDPDREGEAISWHVLQVLKAKKVLKDQPVERVVFNAVTKSAITDAMAKPRAIDVPLVDAYLARRALDYLVGFTLSPVLWRKLPGARSAGRVQSVALRLVCDREREIESFVAQEYWSLIAHLKSVAGDAFEARIVGADGKKITRLDIGSEAQAMDLKAHLERATFTVRSVEAKPTKRNPQPPFTTSTLQQEASRKLGFAAQRTMQIAQRLYEGIDMGGETVGLITYMRTDGVQIAPEAISGARGVIEADYGARYVPEKARFYSTKAKNAQEAHEAIRPTDLRRRPKDVSRFLDAEQAKLYDLVWKRTVASQMQSAEIERTTVDIDAVDGTRAAIVRATGQVMRFDGFLALYQEGKDDEEDEESRRLPKLASGEKPSREKIVASQHFTEPPPRFTEATLIKKMEELGIGRPSTYTSTLTVLRDREYVRLDKKRLVPEDKGRLVTAFLESFFKRYVEYDFTAGLEEELDRISADELDWKEVLRDFWRNFSGAVDEIKDLRVSEVLDALNEILGPHIFPAKEDGTDPRACPQCDDGRLSLKVGRYGAFIGCSNYPECRFTRQLVEGNGEDGAAAQTGPRELGTDPETGEMVTLRDGRFGPYIQLGEGDKPKRATIPKGWDVAAMDLEKALRLLRLPREVGPHPETGQMISAGIGRYGPFVQHERTYANLDNVDEVFTVGLNRAVSLIAEKQAKGGRGRGAAVLKELGEHPDAGGPITVRDGRYGPYVNHGKVNATLPKDAKPEDVTLEQAVEMITAKAGKAPAKKKPAAKKSAAKKAATKKAAAKKPTAKKSTAKKKAADEDETAPF